MGPPGQRDHVLKHNGKSDTAQTTVTLANFGFPVQSFGVLGSIDI
jgi:hypothetical protein